jgi:hypothetical protein
MMGRFQISNLKFENKTAIKTRDQHKAGKPENQRRRKTEIRSQKCGSGSQSSEIRSQKSERRSQQVETLQHGWSPAEQN